MPASKVGGVRRGNASKGEDGHKMPFDFVFLFLLLLSSCGVEHADPVMSLQVDVCVFNDRVSTVGGHGVFPCQPWNLRFPQRFDLPRVVLRASNVIVAMELTYRERERFNFGHFIHTYFSERTWRSLRHSTTIWKGHEMWIIRDMRTRCSICSLALVCVSRKASA
jgi:hypothetical protein